MLHNHIAKHAASRQVLPLLVLVAERREQGLQQRCAGSNEQYFEQTGGGTSPLCMRAELLSSLGCQP